MNIYNYIQDDIATEQLSMMEYIDPFTGKEVQKKKRRSHAGLLLCSC